MENKISVALQILPKSETADSYFLVDKAIEVIQKSGLEYLVCPFETVIVGTYDEVMNVVKKAQEACFEFGANEEMIILKIHRRKNSSVSIDEKLEKYR